MIITKQWLEKKGACPEGIKWLEDKKADFAGDLLVRLLIKEDKLDWANWLIVRIMDYKQRVSYAVYAAEQVIKIYEKEYPDDKRPRKAIEAAKKCIDNPSKENKNAAYAAADAAYAAYATYAAYAAADAAADTAAHAAADAAYAAYATYAAAYAAYAAYATADAAYAAEDNLKKKILEYGLKLLEKT
jgi:hypothetical protein